jgi:hypothetical protein
MVKFVCPESEGARVANDASKLILERLFSSLENANSAVVQTPNGSEELYFSTIKKSGTIEEHDYAQAAVIRYLDFFQFPATLKTAAEFAAFAGITLTQNFTTSEPFYWKVESLSELFATPFWFTVFTDEGIKLLIPDSTGGTRRGKIDRGQIIVSSVQFKNSAIFDGETIPAGSFKNFIARTRVYPSLIDDNLKAMADRKYRSLSDFIIFEADFVANPGDWVEYATNVYVIVSQRRSTGTYQYTAVRECKTAFSYTGADIPFADLYDALNTVFLNGYGIDNTGFTDGLMVQIDETGKELELRPSGAFRARLTGNQTLTNASTYYVLALATEDYDVSGWWNNVTYRFIPQKPGYYFIHASARLTAAITDGAAFNIAIYKNNSQMTVAWDSQSGAVNTQVVQVSDTIYFNGTTDYIDIRCSCADAGKIVNANTLVTFAVGYRVA